ncbi:MAG: SDR family oxidoreductase [Ruminococcus sp.]|nr:SDR family oxidoreductase [Ruminococcus sp.]
MTALITGASSGMGREMARYLSTLGYDLILVARREDRLNALKNEIKNVKVKTIVMDISKQENCFKLYEMTKDADIDFLINNAGFGAYGKVKDVSLERELQLIDTNIKALHILTRLYLKDMIAKDSGYILNVGSIAGYLAGPFLASYYASKNYVVRYTEALREELRRDKINVKVSVLCPGPVRTEFNKVAGVNFIVSGLDSKRVAKLAVDKTLKGKMVIIPGAAIKMLKFGLRFLGENLMTRVSYSLQTKRKN